MLQDKEEKKGDDIKISTEDRDILYAAYPEASWKTLFQKDLEKKSVGGKDKLED